MTVETPWGYTVDELPPMVSVEEFRSLFPDYAATDDQIEAVLASTSAAIRDYCGWHVAPTLECTYTGDGEGAMLILPAMGVSSVESLTVSGNAVTQYEWKANGLLRLVGSRFPDSWRSVVCTYTAGFSGASVAQVVAQIASNALAGAAGVSSETAGGVSISYNRTADGVSGGVSLLPRDKEMLQAYRLVRAW